MSTDPARASAAPLINAAELPSWIVHEDDDLLVFNKPGWVVCHPSKNGPWSSLVGAAREYTGSDRLHLVARLDRETSGLVLLARHRKAASTLQKAFQARHVRKRYLALLEGNLAATLEGLGATEGYVRTGAARRWVQRDERGVWSVHVEGALGRDEKSAVYVKQAVKDSARAQPASTRFEVVYADSRYTWALVQPFTGRKHQIRVHAAWLGHAVAADKLYGPDESLYLDFAEHGWSARHETALPLARQALHAAELAFGAPDFTRTFHAPLTADLFAFCQKEGLPVPPPGTART